MNGVFLKFKKVVKELKIHIILSIICILVLCKCSSFANLFSCFSFLNQPLINTNEYEIFEILENFAFAYLTSFMFYLIVDFIPKFKQDIKVNQCINYRLKTIISEMRNVLNVLGEKYINNFIKDNFLESEINQLLKMKLSDNVNVVKSHNYENFTVREYIKKNTYDVKNEIDNLYKYYAMYISADLMIILEKILKSDYYTVMESIVNLPVEINLKSDTNFFFKYYKLSVQLDEIRKKIYET